MTRVARRFSQSPFGPTYLAFPDDSGIPEVQLTNPGGGALGGDRLALEVSAQANSRATVTTQAATKIYRGPEVVQRAAVRLGPGAFLEYVPHHVIPFAGSHYRQETVVEMAAGATLFAWESVSAGRLAREERFAFSALSTRLRITRDGTVEALDGFDLGRGGEPFGGYAYLATVFILAPADINRLAEELHAVLAALPAFASASAPAPGLVTARILANEAPSLYLALNGTRGVARAELGLPSPARIIG